MSSYEPIDYDHSTVGEIGRLQSEKARMKAALVWIEKYCTPPSLQVLEEIRDKAREGLGRG